MRLLNFRVKRDVATECYLSLLPGAAGGIPANVNRWRKQMGLPPVAPADVQKLEKQVLFSESATFVDLSGSFSGMGGGEARTGYRMLGLLVTNGQQTLTLKMIGPDKTVAAERDNFLALARSFRDREASGDGSKQAPMSWKAPPGWRETPHKSKYRLVTFSPEDSKETQCYVTILGGDGGGLGANIVRWCGEIGAKPLSAAEIGQLEKVRLLGRDGPLLELMGGKFTGMGSAPIEDAGLLGVVCQLPGRVVFVKMVGPAKIVQRERSRFLAFCESMELK